MNIEQVKNSVINAKDKIAVASLAGFASVSSFAAEADVDAKLDVSEIVDALEDAQKPIASVAAASLGSYVAIRVWKMVRKAI